MVSDSEYQQRIGSYDWPGLLDLWQSVQRGDTPGWEPGRAFEYLVLRAFQLEGADVRWPYTVSIGGEQLEQIDGIIYSDCLACLLECKDQSEGVSIEPIAKLRNQLLRRPPATVGAVFSSRSEFTEAAVILVQFTAPQTIILWHRKEVDYALRHQRMRDVLARKYRFCIEHGLSDYSITAEDVA